MLIELYLLTTTQQVSILASNSILCKIEGGSKLSTKIKSILNLGPILEIKMQWAMDQHHLLIFRERIHLVPVKIFKGSIWTKEMLNIRMMKDLWGERESQKKFRNTIIQISPMEQRKILRLIRVVLIQFIIIKTLVATM